MCHPAQLLCFSALTLSACLRPRPAPPGPDNVYHFDQVRALDASLRKIAGQASPQNSPRLPQYWTPHPPGSLCVLLANFKYLAFVCMQALLPSPTASAAHAINLASSQHLVVAAVDNQDPPRMYYATQAALDLWVSDMPITVLRDAISLLALGMCETRTRRWWVDV
jgi:hypothetical protein